MKITIRDKNTLEEIMQLDYFTMENITIDKEIAAIYAIYSMNMVMWQDPSNIMEFIMWLRTDALNWKIHEVENMAVKNLKEKFDISFVDLWDKIQKAGNVEDLFN